MPAAMIRALTELGFAGALTGLVVSIGTRVRYHSRAGWEHDVPRRILAFAARGKLARVTGWFAWPGASAAARKRDGRIISLPLAGQDPIQWRRNAQNNFSAQTGFAASPANIHWTTRHWSVSVPPWAFI